LNEIEIAKIIATIMQLKRPIAHCLCLCLSVQQVHDDDDDYDSDALCLISGEE